MFVLFLILLIAAICDARTMTVPIILWPVPIVFKIISFCMQGKSLQDAFLAALLVFLVFGLFSALSRFGGADVLAFTAIAFVLEWNAFTVILLSFLLSIPYLLVLQVRGFRKEYPFLPFIFFAFLLFIFFRIVKL